jgi:V-type H+-transporting ATPase subunit E
MLVHNAKLKIQDEFDRKDKDREIQARINRSAAVGATRLKKMKTRDEMMKGIISEVTGAAHAKITSDKAAYKALLVQLMVQALIKMDEPKVKVCCRACDLALCQEAAPVAAKTYVDLMLSACGDRVTCELAVSEEDRDMLPGPPQEGASMVGGSCSGGVVMKAHRDRIICDNTLDTRLALIWEETQPKIRGTLFPAAASTAV